MLHLKYKTVLVVEDSLDLQVMLKKVLEKKGFVVFIAENGEEALKKLAVIGQPCLLLTDLMMPVMDGYQLVAAIKADPVFCTTNICVMSAGAAPIPGVQFLPKPFPFDRLFSILADACQPESAA